jgi:hypothetical protein
MSYYWEYNLKFRLRDTTPVEIINILDQCTNRMEEVDDFYKEGGLRTVGDGPDLNIEHPFGKLSRWQNIFDQAKFNKDDKYKTFISKGDINHGLNEIKFFVGWLAPYIVQSRRKKGTYLGWYKGEGRGEQNHIFLEEILLAKENPQHWARTYYGYTKV